MATLHDIWQHHYSGDFAAGVKLLADHNPAAVTRQIMSRLQTIAATGAYVGNYEIGKLAWGLQNTPVSEDIALTPPPAAAKAAPAPDTETPEKAPATTTPKAKELHKAQAFEHAQLVTADTDQQRANHATTIMEDIVPELDKEYDSLRAAQPEETEIVVHPILDLSEAQKLKRLQSLRSRISAIRKKLNQKQKPERLAELQKQLADNVAEKDQLEKELS